MHITTRKEEKLTQYERREFEACLGHFEQLLIQAGKSPAVCQMVQGLISPQERQGIPDCEVVELLWDRVKLDNIYPDENPCVAHVSNGYRVISIFCDLKIEVFKDTIFADGTGEFAPDHSWNESDSSFYKKIQCYQAMVKD
tara:strand:+ start:9339 stop:9761 length:423 start_codon:yes stop_codon:yes gene_type:complete